MKIQCNLYQFRTRRGLTLQRLSRICGISFSYLSELENNEKLPRIDYAYRLAQTFDVSVYDLFEVVKK